MTEYELASLEIAKQANYIQIGLIILTFLSVIGFYIDYRNRKNKEKAEKSILLAEQFAKETIDKLSFILHSFQKLGLDKLINKVKFFEFRDFDSEELEELYSKEDINTFKNILNKNDEDGNLRTVIAETLNELEYMCMYISTGVANEKCIYHSLHQQFLKTISYLYFYITLINTDNKDKYYTNIITVYNMWTDKYMKACKKEKKLKNKLKPKNKRLN